MTSANRNPRWFFFFIGVSSEPSMRDRAWKIGSRAPASEGAEKSFERPVPPLPHDRFQSPVHSNSDLRSQSDRAPKSLFPLETSSEWFPWKRAGGYAKETGVGNTAREREQRHEFRAGVAKPPASAALALSKRRPRLPILDALAIPGRNANLESTAP